MAQRTKRPFAIAMWNPASESWRILARFKSYNNADDRLDSYSNRYPNAWVEILDQRNQIPA